MGRTKTQPSVLCKPLDAITSELSAPSDYERLASEFIEAAALAQIAGGSGGEQSLHANLRALAGIELNSRILQYLGEASTRVTLLGQPLRHPVLLAPVSAQTLVHPQGELATAAGAAEQEAGLVVSTLASKPMEEIAAQTDAPKWFQLYIQPSREHTRALIGRAEEAGFGALMVTLNAPIQPPVYRALRAGFVLPDHARPANLTDSAPRPQAVLQPDQSPIFQGVMSEAPSWDELAWVLEQTSLPTIAKGVMHPQDVRRLVDMGIDCIAVSNHGGRALDAMPASIHCLPGIREAVGDDFPLLMDGGIRSGYDVFKAIAMGADAVMIGRLQIYALAIAGHLGVAHLIKLVRNELEFAMSLAGCASIENIDRECLFARTSL
ncbi:MAG: alpha-hydroxy-acid oxidizing protein [Proteobacteria bacterium]|nr:alpha-hydroxy-acid oxidizing protein [Pseudomonadota bacterium]